MTEDDLDQADKDVRFRCLAEFQLAEINIVYFCQFERYTFVSVGVNMLEYILSAYMIINCQSI